MTADLTPFRSDEFELTVTPHDVDGFRVLAPDLARALGFRQALDLTRAIPEEEKGYELVRTPGGDQSFTVISEPGLFSAILRSRVPKASE